MKKSIFSVLVALFVFNISLFADTSIHLQFQPDSPIDSIRIENLDNLSAQTFVGQNVIDLLFDVPMSVSSPAHSEEWLRVFSAANRNDVQIAFNLSLPGKVICEIFDLQGRRKCIFSAYNYRNFNTNNKVYQL